jgi:hypothetical protein
MGDTSDPADPHASTLVTPGAVGLVIVVVMALILAASMACIAPREHPVSSDPGLI